MVDVLQQQPVDVLLLGGALRAMGGPDSESMLLYATGVLVGLGVEMPRTPRVSPPKQKWSLKEQPEWGGPSWRSDAFDGVTMANYPSAVKLNCEVAAVLRHYEKEGQILIMAESEAKKRYGARLTIAALSALEKGMSPEGLVDVRVLHDGTNGVSVNRFIRVRDGGISPTAADMKAALRRQSGRKRPY